MPHTAVLDAYPLTLAVWVKTGATGLRGIVNKYLPASMNGYQIFTNGGNLCAWYFKDASDYVWDGTGCTLMTGGYNDSQWHQVVFVVDASGGRLYVDAALKASRPWTGTPGPATTAADLNLARYPGTAQPYLAGSLDEVRLYNRALSDQEILGLYAADRTTTESVVWTNLVNVTASGGTLQKTAGCDGCPDAGATSLQQIASGDGYFEFTAVETAALRVAGLSNLSAGTGAWEIAFAIRLQSGYAEVREAGVYRESTAFGSGDTFRVSIESGRVEYARNGVVFYTSTAAPVYPLFVDTSLFDSGGTIVNAVIRRAP